MREEHAALDRVADISPKLCLILSPDVFTVYEDISSIRLQQEIAFEKAEEMVGKELWCMVEGKIADEYAYVARTYRDAPDVDGYLFIQTMEELMSGDFVKVRVTGAEEYDLIGEIADEFTE